MAIEDVGVRLVIENLSGFTSGMDQVNQTVTTQESHLGSLASVYEKAQRRSRSFKEQVGNLRPALAAVNSVFHTAISGMLFFMSTNDNMSDAMRTTMKVVTGVTLSITALTSLYRLYAARQTLAAAAVWLYNAAAAAGTPIAAAFGLAVEAGIWPITLCVLAIAALIGGIILLVKNWEKVARWLGILTPAQDAYNRKVAESKEKIKLLEGEEARLDRQQGKNQERLKRLNEDYNHLRDTMGGYKEYIEATQAAIDSNTASLEALGNEINEINSELSGLAQPRLEGMQEYEDQIWQVEQEIKFWRLEQLKTDKPSQDLQDRIDALEKQKQTLELTRDLKFDPLERAANEAVEDLKGLNEELAPSAVFQRINDLGNLLEQKTQKMNDLKAANIELEGQLKSVTDVVSAQLQAFEDQIEDVNEDIYQTAVELRGVADALTGIKTALDNLGPQKSTWSQIGDFLAQLGSLPAQALSAIGLNFQHGGETPGGRVLVGERGPEVVSLPAGSYVHPNTYNTSYNITAHYANPQQPASIAMDLEYIRMRSRA